MQLERTQNHITGRQVLLYASITGIQVFVEGFDLVSVIFYVSFTSKLAC